MAIQTREQELEDFANEARSVLFSISAGGMLHPLPSAASDREAHESAIGLLQLLQRRLDALAA